MLYCFSLAFQFDSGSFHFVREEGGGGGVGFLPNMEQKKKKSLQQRVWLCGGMGVSFIPNITILMALMLFLEEEEEGEGC